MFTSTSRVVILCGTVIVLAVLGGVFFLVADNKLTGSDAVNVVFVVLGALGVGTAGHFSAVAAKGGNGPL